MGAPRPGSERQTLLDTLRDLLADALRLLRAEIGLLKAQGAGTAKRGAIAAALLAAAGAGTFVFVILLLGTAATAIGEALGHLWLGWLIVAAFVLVVAGGLALIGYLQMRKAITEAKQVGTTVKEDLEWVRQLPRRNANGS
jgi:cytochrome c biogenesis protein CcdA